MDIVSERRCHLLDHVVLLIFFAELQGLYDFLSIFVSQDVCAMQYVYTIGTQDAPPGAVMASGIFFITSAVLDGNESVTNDE